MDVEQLKRDKEDIENTIGQIRAALERLEVQLLEHQGALKYIAQKIAQAEQEKEQGRFEEKTGGE